MNDEIEDDSYECEGCERIVDPYLEPSAGEPHRCQDCENDRKRDYTVAFTDHEAWT